MRTETSTLAEAPPRARAALPILAFRDDIQGLRGVAVLLVMVYHIWPSVLPGGYVGVDVFFVISGYLITGLLAQEAERTGSISLTRFYCRRALRLLPAATAVIVVSGVLALVALPPVLLATLGGELAGSALYVQNLVLYFAEVDYLNEGILATPVRHFWSLSIEEQFYLFWPVLLLAVVARAGASRTRGIALMLALTVAALSFSYALPLTRALPEAAYFSSFTRIWELAVGALLALALRQPVNGWARAPLATCGLLGIVLAALLFSDETPFPGHAALLPVLAAACLLAAGGAQSASFPGRTSGLSGAIITTRPLVYVGDVSYSLYLWHWPVVFLLHRLLDGQALGLTAGVSAAAVSLLLAHLSKRWLEDPLRKHPALLASPLRTGLLALALVAASLGAAAAVQARYLMAYDAAMGIGTSEAEHPGAMVRAGDTELRADGAGASFVPALWVVKDDVPAVYGDDCHVPRREADIRPCTYGETSSALEVVLVGDSHASHWLPALETLADAEGFRITVHAKSACPFADVGLLVRGAAYEACSAWNERVLEDIVERRPGLVVTAMTSSYRAAGVEPGAGNDELIVVGLRRQWRRLAEAHVPVLAIASTPRFAFDVPECLADATAERCARNRSEVLPRAGWVTTAADGVSGVRVFDANDVLCREGVCEPVIGNVLVYRDQHHLTSTFARTLAPFLEGPLRDAMRDAQQR